jgi:hypothetical protein
MMSMMARRTTMNSKTKNNAEAEAGVLAQFGQLREVLAETHSTIPRLLAQERSIAHELGLAEARGEGADALHKRLEDVIGQRQSAIRRRSASIEAIGELEGPLQAARAAAERERQAHGIVALAEFRRRYDDATSNLQALWNEGKLLGEALKVQVPMPMPVKVSVSVVDSVARAQPIFPMLRRWRMLRLCRWPRGWMRSTTRLD